MDKDTIKQVMRPRYRDTGRGEKIRTIVSYSQLTESLQNRIAPDITIRELQEMAISTLDKINLCLYKLSGLEIIEDDIVWPT